MFENAHSAKEYIYIRLTGNNYYIKFKVFTTRNITKQEEIHY